MKKCTKCQKELNELTAYKRNDSKCGLTSKCRSCLNKECTETQVQRKRAAINSKGGQCYDCKQIFPYPVFEFHHLDPSQKDLDWSKMRIVNKKRLESELAKCVLLCANCHRIRHYELSLVGRKGIEPFYTGL